MDFFWVRELFAVTQPLFIDGKAERIEEKTKVRDEAAEALSNMLDIQGATDAAIHEHEQAIVSLVAKLEASTETKCKMADIVNRREATSPGRIVQQASVMLQRWPRSNTISLQSFSYIFNRIINWCIHVLFFFQLNNYVPIQFSWKEFFGCLSNGTWMIQQYWRKKSPTTTVWPRHVSYWRSAQLCMNMRTRLVRLNGSWF